MRSTTIFSKHRAIPVVGTDQQDVVVHGCVVGGDAADGDEELSLGLSAALLVLQGRQHLSQRPRRQHGTTAGAAFNLQHVGAVDYNALGDGLDLHRRGDWDEAGGDGSRGHRGGRQCGRLLVLVVLVITLHLDDVIGSHFVRSGELLGVWSALDPHDGGLAERDAFTGRLLRLVVLHFDEAAVKGEVIDCLLKDGLVVSLHHRPSEVLLSWVETSVVGQQGVIATGLEMWVNVCLINKNIFFK